MDRNREARRTSIMGSNGFKRRRHRTNSLRGSPDEDLGVELQDSVRLRDRAKKDREREREKERELRERANRSKRRRAERLTCNREEVGVYESSEESVNDDEDDEDEENSAGGGFTDGGMRLLPVAAGSLSNHHHNHVGNHHHLSSLSQQHNISSTNNNNNNIVNSSKPNLQAMKTFPPISSSSSSSKVFRAGPAWKPSDEMIGVSVPRKARSACAKRSHDWIFGCSNNNSNNNVAGGELICLQTSSSPVRQGLVSTSAPMSPSSSNASMRKKLKLNNGPKLKPPKGSMKIASSNPEELEIEIAEVLYGLKTQSQTSSVKKEDTRSISDTKSRVSSPISNSASASNPISAPNSSPLTAVAPKRKRPRQVVEKSGFGGRSSPVFPVPEIDQVPKCEISSPKVERFSGSTAENVLEIAGDSVHSQDVKVTEPVKNDSELKSTAEELQESVDLVKQRESSSTKGNESSVVRTEESCVDDSTLTATASAAVIKASSMLSELDNQREEKFVIDLMAPPPNGRSSPEKESSFDVKASALNQRQDLSTVDSELKAKEDCMQNGNGHLRNKSIEEKLGVKVEEGELQKVVENKRNIGIQLDAEKCNRDVVSASANRVQQQPMPPKVPKEEPLSGKSGQASTSLPLPLAVASWPGSLPSMGYLAPLQGVVSTDGSTVTPAPIQPFSQPRPRRCATHYYIARNINYLQQLMKINPFWQVAAGPASIYGSKPGNLNSMQVTDLHGNSVKGVKHVPDKAQNLVSTTGLGTKEKGSQSVATSESAQRKQQILLQQPLPPVAPSNLVGPAFIFPLNQQQAAAAAAASVRPGAAKSHLAVGQVASNNARPVAANASAPAGAATAMSFNYPNLGGNETQYLAILQNNAYPFPIQAVGGPPSYRGAPAQTMPLINGSFYSPQMIHPSQLQHQLPPASQASQLQQVHQNASPTGGSSNQKHLQSSQLRLQSVGVNGVAESMNLQNFTAQKSQPPQQPHNQHFHTVRPRHLDTECDGEENLPSNDGRGGSWASVNIYGQNFAMPIHPQNFALMTPPAVLASVPAGSGSGMANQSEKKPHQGSKSGVDGAPPNSFAMSFGSINGTAPGSGIDIASMAQTHTLFQGLPEATRQNIQMAAAAVAVTSQVAQKKNFRITEDTKSGGDSSATEDERKSLAGKGQVGQSIAFSRSDLADNPVSVSAIPANNVIESSARSLNASTGSGRNSRSAASSAVGNISAQNAHIHVQHLQQQQLLQLKHQQQLLTVNRTKAPATSNGNVYAEHLNSSPSISSKFNTISGFPQNVVQSNSSAATQSQWKNSPRNTASPVPSSLESSTVSTVKSLPQPHSRVQPQLHNQISFGGNQKPLATSQGQVPPGCNQVSTPPIMVGSPPGSVSKGSSGSPRATHAPLNSKMSQASSLSAQQPKHTPAIACQKSPSIMGISHVAPPPSTGAKSHVQPQSQTQHLPKNIQQAHLFFSNPYPQVQSQHATSTSSSISGPGGFYMQRRRPDQNHQAAQQLPAVSATSSPGVLSITPGTTAGASMNVTAKAIAAANSNVKTGGGFPSQGIIHAAAQLTAQSAGTLLPVGFSYAHPVEAAVEAKPPEQKQSAGNDNSQTLQPEKK